MKTKIISLALLLVLLTSTGLGCKGGNQAAQQAALEQVRLEYWRVFDDDDALDDIIKAYRETHPNVSIDVVKKRYEEYEDELLRSFAEGNGPDIFSVHNTWLGTYQSLATPMPDSVELVYQEVTGGLKSEVIAVIREEETMSIRDLETNFVDVVAEDVVRSYQPDSKTAAEDKIWALPYSVDTLALFYNKDILNSEGIAEPPTSWSEFQEAVQEISLLDLDGDVVQSGAALGTTENVERAFDIVSILMMQNGTPMTSSSGKASFSEVPEGSSSRVPPALSALEFYTDFANPVKVVYSWNEGMDSSFDEFANGTTAFFLGYSYHIPLLRAQSPKLNFDITPLPQISDSRTVNYANYWVETVSKDSDYSDYAWDFIQFAASAEQVTSYLDEADRPTALRSLINTQSDDLDLSVFANQVLTANSWYRGNDAAVTEEAFLDLIDAYLAGSDEPDHDLSVAQSKVNQTYD